MGGLMEPALEVALETAYQKAKEEYQKAEEEYKKATEEVVANVAATTKKESKLEDIRNLMETLNLNIQQAMDALKIPPAEQSQYLSLI